MFIKIWTKGNTVGFIGKLFSYLDLIFIDHGIFRFYWRSLHKVSTDVYRSNQPFPWQIINDLKNRGIKTIINLRGKRDCSSYYLEKEICKKYNITLINFPVTSRAAPEPDKIVEAKKLFENVEYPIIMHCKSGADRAGLMSALYLILHKNINVEKAKKQLSLKYLHLKYAKTGILDAFFDEYLLISKKSNISFLEWATTKYNPDVVKSKFKPKKIIEIIITVILRRE